MATDCPTLQLDQEVGLRCTFELVLFLATGRCRVSCLRVLHLGAKWDECECGIWGQSQ